MRETLATDIDVRLFEASESMAFWREVLPEREERAEEFFDKDGVVIEPEGVDYFLHEIFEALDQEYIIIYADLVGSKAAWHDDRFEIIKGAHAEIQGWREVIAANPKYKDHKYWDRKKEREDKRKEFNTLTAARLPVAPQSLAGAAMAGAMHRAKGRHAQRRKPPERKEDWRQIIAKDNGTRVDQWTKRGQPYRGRGMAMYGNVELPGESEEDRKGRLLAEMREAVRLSTERRRKRRERRQK